ncbi:hypothetical protein OG352_27770 [Streptomyces sp. NBC_01485]|uniref:hypothetical protein n=1 Tax=Streptomyces sp. NBC_01485 TaxID=2903884 RepID=UPI002E3382D4|nr:hypothetical protein [Streptomyces sp. NBC_01485]
MLRTTRRIARTIGAVALPLLLLPACSGERTATTDVSVAKVAGSWKGPDGERVSLTSDHAFTSAGLDSPKLKDTHCAGGEDSGTWGFYVPDGDDGEAVSDTAGSGDWIGLSFKSDATQEFPCSVQLAVVDGGRTLCATDDPDLPCGLDVRFTRAS